MVLRFIFGVNDITIVLSNQWRKTFQGPFKATDAYKKRYWWHEKSSFKSNVKDGVHMCISKHLGTDTFNISNFHRMEALKCVPVYKC